MSIALATALVIVAPKLVIPANTPAHALLVVMGQTAILLVLGRDVD